MLSVFGCLSSLILYTTDARFWIAPSLLVVARRLITTSLEKAYFAVTYQVQVYALATLAIPGLRHDT